MDSTGDQLKVAFLPFAAPGHMIPLMDAARLFARHGADVTFITTSANAARFQKDVDSDFRSGHTIKISYLQLPSAKVGLPPGVETFGESTSPEISGKLGAAFEMLNQQIEELLGEMKADCIVSDMILSWTTDAAARLGIPRLVFQCSGFISQCFDHSLRCYRPHEKVESDTDPFILPGLPHKIEMTRLELAKWLCTSEERIIQYIEKALQAEKNSHGVLMNSFHELEADYIEYYKRAIGLKTWAIGPVSLWVNKANSTESGNNSKIEDSDVMEWLNSKEINSVLYISFGSMAKFPSTQLLEIAHGLEDSGHHFIWVVQKMNTEDEGLLLPEGFEERMKERKRGLIIRGWAPQVLILNHPSVGGFVSHCGWNSVIESVCGGQPIIAWPLVAEQFYNQKLVTQVLKIGVSVGARKWWDLRNSEELDIVTRDQITKAVVLLMGDDREVVEMRDRVRKLAGAAKIAVSNGGSSYNNMVSLIDELKMMKLKRQSLEVIN